MAAPPLGERLFIRMGFERMKSRFLDAAAELNHIRDDRNETTYSLQLTFVDPFGRNRKHTAMVTLPRDIVVQNRVSFTAISSADVRIGVIEKITDVQVDVMLFDGSKVSIGNRHEPEFVTGDKVTVIERLDPMNTDRRMSLAVLPCPLRMAHELLALQTVNADILDDSGSLIYRMSADPLFTRGCNDARVEA